MIDTGKKSLARYKQYAKSIDEAVIWKIPFSEFVDLAKSAKYDADVNVYSDHIEIGNLKIYYL